MQVYPDAGFAVTHRDPVEVLASNCSYATYLRGLFSDHVDRAEVGRQMKDLVGRHIRGLVDFDVNREGQVVVQRVALRPGRRRDRFEAARGKATVKWRTDELMALLRAAD